MTDAVSEVVEVATVKTTAYLERIDANRSKCLTETFISQEVLEHETRKVGKVRDIYTCTDKVVLVATDRQSAFDRNLASVPFKGQVLNMTSNWWFQQSVDIIPNHVLSVPHPNVTVARRCTVFPVEFVVRGYMTGSTNTSMWTHYSKGERNYCGHTLPDGMVKSQRLPEPLLTPTTKDDTHDELISASEVVSSGRMSQEHWDVCADAALRLFALGQQEAAKRGLILVDTKYEFGVDDSDGSVRLIDEIHTPDSSRYWVAASYDARMASGEAPENIDKEFLRLWFRERCDPYKDEVLPEAPADLVNELSRRYIMLFELITSEDFAFPSSSSTAATTGGDDGAGSESAAVPSRGDAWDQVGLCDALRSL